MQETNASGAVTLEREYDPWGVATQSGSTSGYGFTGREWDAETQLHYYRARYYSPGHGRFLSEDPIGFDAGDANFYSMTFNSPLYWTDPSGMEVFPKGVPISKLPASKQEATVALVTLAVATVAPPIGPLAAGGGKLLRDNIKVDGPSAGYGHPDGGRFCQLRVRSQVIARVDYQQRKPGAAPECHVHLFPTKKHPHGLELPPRKWS